MIYYALLYVVSTVCIGLAIVLNARTLRDLERRVQKLEETALTWDTPLPSNMDRQTYTLTLEDVIEPLPVSVKEHL